MTKQAKGPFNPKDFNLTQEEFSELDARVEACVDEGEGVYTLAPLIRFLRRKEMSASDLQEVLDATDLLAECYGEDHPAGRAWYRLQAVLYPEAA
jgi:hypothetical protein